MSVSITNITRANGPGCNHLTITVDVEGVERTIHVDPTDLDFDDAISPQQLIVAWARYRYKRERPVVGVEIA